MAGSVIYKVIVVDGEFKPSDALEFHPMTTPTGCAVIDVSIVNPLSKNIGTDTFIREIEIEGFYGELVGERHIVGDTNVYDYTGSVKIIYVNGVPALDQATKIRFVAKKQCAIISKIRVHDIVDNKDVVDHGPIVMRIEQI